ncbi:MAG TPA: hypothetical protein VGM67_18420 [Gemmatimonadaceae bacterium]|jgi:hypothetical protein
MKFLIVALLAAHVAATNSSAQTSPAAAHLSDSTLAARVAGCYELVDDGWEKDSALAKFDSLPQVPLRFAITGCNRRSQHRVAVGVNPSAPSIRRDYRDLAALLSRPCHRAANPTKYLVDRSTKRP